MNTTLEELKNLIAQEEQNIEKSEQTIKELKLQIERAIDKYPKKGTTVYLLTDIGTIHQYRWAGDIADKSRFNQGNIFLTYKDASFEKEKRRVITELKLFEEPKDRPWRLPDYLHYYLDCDVEEKRITFDNNWCYRHGTIYFASKEDAQNAIDYVGVERVKKYYLGIE